ncbi:MAG TPA: TQO small subunit DoxD, partial [Anaerolineae bacterium]|nr:TQO small subunit DoxD [Anaerolineae bacterium]
VRLQRTSGLCDWLGVESVWAQQPRLVLVSNLDNTGQPEIAVDIGFLAQLNGAFIDGFVKPNIQWFGYVVWGMEAFIFVSLFLGLLSRLGGLVAIAQSAQLMIGLAGIGNPYEFEWTYHSMLVLSVLMFAFAPGRYLGLDAWLRPRLAAAAEKGSRLAGVLKSLT